MDKTGSSTMKANRLTRYVRQPSHLLLLGFLITSLVLLLTPMSTVDVFSDGTYLATVVREVVETERYATASPVGWVDPHLTPLSLDPPVLNPPLFIVLNAALASVTGDIVGALNVTNILPIVMLLVLFHEVTKVVFGEDASRYALLFLAFTPMFIWVAIHRLIEPLVYFLSSSSFLLSVLYLRKPSWGIAVTLSLILSALLQTKLTGVPVALSVAAALVLWRRDKKTLLILGLTGILLTPYIYGDLAPKGTVSYGPPGIPYLDTDLFQPWWTMKRAPWDEELKQITNEEALFNIRIQVERERRDRLQDYVSSGRPLSVLQFLSALPVDPGANVNNFSPEARRTFYLFLPLFVLGLFVFTKKRLWLTEYGKILLLSTLIMLPFHLLTGDRRYLFSLALLYSVVYALGLREALGAARARQLKLLIIGGLLVTATIMTYSQIRYVQRFSNSFRHDYIKPPGGLTELAEFLEGTSIPPDENVFTTSNAEVAWYTHRPTIWDYRILFLNSTDDVVRFYSQYNATYLIISNHFLQEEVYSTIAGDWVPNDKANWVGNGIPRDSAFYFMLTEEIHFEKLNEYIAFTVYRFRP
ncbi:MAG: hypothetical protein ACE5IJ_03905 [Thermoplasmata archaeon]